MFSYSQLHQFLCAVYEYVTCKTIRFNTYYRADYYKLTWRIIPLNKNNVECTVQQAIFWLSEYVTHVIRTQTCNPSTCSLIWLPVHTWLMPILTRAFIKPSPFISTDLTVPRVNYVASPVNVWPDRWYRLQLDAGQRVVCDASDWLPSLCKTTLWSWKHTSSGQFDTEIDLVLGQFDTEIDLVLGQFNTGIDLVLG